MKEIVLGYYVACSIVTFGIYAVDKRSAQRGGRRISERALNGWALVGGFAGAITGQLMLRHKTRHPGMIVVAWLALALHAGAWAWRLSAST
ncbi:MAG: cold-shock DNA-binding domain protein [Verrucomicrobia bacterium]|nr:cold-shock DNA-binding domain protein [Verrucomicrobiota bacterium]